MSIDLKFVELTADVLEIYIIKYIFWGGGGGMLFSGCRGPFLALSTAGPMGKIRTRSRPSSVTRALTVQVVVTSVFPLPDLRRHRDIITNTIPKENLVLYLD